MSEWIGRGRKARRAYGFDEIALVPGSVTINPDEVDATMELGGKKYAVPIIAAAMDGVVDVAFAIAMGKLGGLGILNLEGIQTRYEDPSPQLQKIIEAPSSTVTELLQAIYKEPIKEDLIGRRIEEIRAGGVAPIVSAIPQRAARFGPIAQ